jgi:hypothetical protein
MHLFEWVHDSNHYIKKLAYYYESLGFFTRILPPQPDPALDIADNEDFDYDWQHPDHSGMFLYIYPNYNEDVRFTVHINSIVIAKNRQGTGLAGKMVDGLVKIMGYDLESIEFSDYSKGFWKKMEEKYPKIKFVFED